LAKVYALICGYAQMCGMAGEGKHEKSSYRAFNGILFEMAVEIVVNPLTEREKGRFPPNPQPQALNDLHLIELWLHSHLSEHTRRAYRADVEGFRRLFPKLLAHVTLADLQQFADSLENLRAATRQRCLSSIKALFAFGHRIGYLPFDVGRVLKVPAAKDTLSERILSESDLHRMLTLEPDERNRVLLFLLYASGVRRGELAGLLWKDLQASGDSGQVTVLGKGGKTRSILLPESVWKQSQRLRGKAAADDPVFPSRKKGKPLTESGIWRIVKRAGKRAGLEASVSPHWLRHAHASHALDRGAPIHLVQATLGHASINTTGRYLHARPKDSSSRFLPL
jgi:integrase/recombinase XerD